MDDINTRIKQYMEIRKLSGASLAREIGMASVTVNQYVSGKRKISWEFILSILNNDKRLSAEWLTRGKGKMYENGSNSNESDEKTTKELAEAKLQMLVKDGIIKELREMILEKNQGVSDERKSTVG